jgi:integrase
MPRPRRDGTPAREARKQRLTDQSVRRIKAESAAFAVWDTYQRGLVCRVQPTGQKSWKAVYSRGGRPRWFHIGDASAVGISDARRIAARIMAEVAEGEDPVAERMAARGSGTFAELAERYVEEYAKRRNKSWKQADALVRKHLLPRWGELDAKGITRSDVRAMVGSIDAPVLANQVRASASAIFSWGVKQEVVATNPCMGVDGNETRSRERVLSDSELPRFWTAFDDAGLVRSSALKVILLTGQRPGEVSHMRREHIVDGWWQLPGKPDPTLGWPGTKNGQSHRVWLPGAVRDIIVEIDGDSTAGFVFTVGSRGNPVGKLAEAMRDICTEIGVEDKVTPHDLRRTHGSTVTRLGFGRDAMNRIQNHIEGGIADVYDRHRYEGETRKSWRPWRPTSWHWRRGDRRPTWCNSDDVWILRPFWCKQY